MYKHAEKCQKISSMNTQLIKTGAEKTRCPWVEPVMDDDVVV